MARELENRPSTARRRRGSVSALVVFAAGAAACMSPRSDGSPSAPAAPFTGAPPAAAPAAPPAPAPNIGVPGGGEVTPAPGAALDAPAPVEAAGPAPEAPLTPEEESALAGFDGLVRATDWSIPVAKNVTETTVARAYLDWKARFYQSCGDGTDYVLKDDYTGSQYIVSEGIAYGMLLSVGMGDREVFDGLWAYYREHRNQNGLMNWRYDVCGGGAGDGGASDADLDAAMALVLAESRWGGFVEDAQALVSAIAEHETDTCDDGNIVLKPGDGWGGCGGDTVNPSYFSPAYYRRFALLQPDRAEFWNQFATDTYEMLSGMQDQVGGLLPDWGFGDGRAEADPNGRGQYGYEAVRAPWRIALDLAWSNDAAPRALLARMSETIDSSGGLTALADSDSFEDKRNSAFLGSLSLSGTGVSQEKFDGYVTEWLSYEDVDDSWYYQATLRVLYLMVAGGYFPVSH
jgi:endo-1,4-beta-D-glucanase Y